MYHGQSCRVTEGVEMTIAEEQDYRRRSAIYRSRIEQNEGSVAAVAGRREREYEAEQQSKIDDAREAADESLKREIRRHFLVQNPNANDNDFERVWPRLRDEHLVRQAQTGMSQQVEALREKSILQF